MRNGGMEGKGFGKLDLKMYRIGRNQKFQGGQVLEGVHCADPFASKFDLEAWLVPSCSVDLGEARKRDRQRAAVNCKVRRLNPVNTQLLPTVYLDGEIFHIIKLFVRMNTTIEPEGRYRSGDCVTEERKKGIGCRGISRGI